MCDDVIVLYRQIRYIPNCMLYELFPSLEDPSDELQYQLLKLDYGLLELTKNVVAAINRIQTTIESMAESFKNLDEIISESWDDELLVLWEYPIPKPPSIIVVYSYIKDTRREIRKYLRNRVY